MMSRCKKHTGLKRLAVAVPAVAMVSVATPWLAAADVVAVDGDGVDISNSKNSKFELCAGDPSSVDVYATISYQGSKHFKSGSTVTITTSIPTGAANFLTAAGGSVVTANWDNTSDSVTTDAMKIAVDSDWVAGTYPVTYTVTGTGTDNKAYVLTDTNNVHIGLRETGCGGGGGEEEPPPPPPNTAPTVDVTGFIDGGSVEINTPVTPACDVVDDEDTNESAIPRTDWSGLNAYGLGLVSVTCSYTDGSGSSGTDTETYTIVDTGAPTITRESVTPAAPNGSNGWYTSAVTSTFRATDTGAGFQTATPPLLTYLLSPSVSTGTAEGSGLTVSSGTISDVAGNTAAAINSGPFKVDLSNPVLNVSGTAGGAVNVCDGAPTRPSFAPSDAISGVDTQGDTWTTPSTGSGVGAYVYTATATDMAGRSTTDTRTYTSVYGSAFTGVTQPINGGATADFADDNSRFKLGSTVPVKFRLVCDTTPISNAVAKLSVRRLDSQVDPGFDEPVSTSAATTGNLFRYDALAGQYIFNLSTKTAYTDSTGATITWAQGTYVLKITLDDGTTRSVQINIFK